MPPYGSSHHDEDPPMYTPAPPPDGEGTPAPPSSVDITSAPPSPSWQQLYGEVGRASDEILHEEHRVPGMFPRGTPSQSDSRSVSSIRTTQSMPTFPAPNVADDDNDCSSEPGCTPYRGGRSRIRRRMRSMLRFGRR
ncbi:hypothetical protein NLG97_g500 [Lecanicillium saksenae]|uniref:Uncharacterized protein n=1 Tax=Lecanicillium saksenae TaxID=468837 RepID=A0ACC1R8B2_9HYPO|nr:hypothetical protein NLG97_g500 [Lecanicillium saksenae]